jgi:hypothetical protein
MALYFLLLDAEPFHAAIVPPLAAAWKQRSFAPCGPLCASLVPTAADFARRYFLGAEEPLLAAVVRGLPFTAQRWQALAGEVLWFAAADVPEIPTAPETLLRLLGEANRLAIQQAHHGSRDLTFGSAFYRPGFAGYNDREDVARLAAWLAGIDPAAWDSFLLDDIAEPEERAEEREYARQGFLALRELYLQADARGHIVVCEEV